jgi:TPR repeat protein
MLAMVCLYPGGSVAVAGYQTHRSSPGCTGGGKEADELFQTALNYHFGIRGLPRNIDKAIKFYEESLELGNPKAALNLGYLYRTEFSLDRKSEQERYNYMNALFEHAVKMGCPDGYYYLGESHANGWGVPKNLKKSDEYLLKGVEAGSLPAMVTYGLMLKGEGNREEAKQWLHMAMDGGFGKAADDLARIYWGEKNYEKQIEILRQGAKLGDTMCLFTLREIYRRGENGQIKDEEYASCFRKLYEAIEENAPPPYIDNLDELCPPRPVIPYSGEE